MGALTFGVVIENVVLIVAFIFFSKTNQIILILILMFFKV